MALAVKRGEIQASGAWLRVEGPMWKVDASDSHWSDDVIAL